MNRTSVLSFNVGMTDEYHAVYMSGRLHVLRVGVGVGCSLNKPTIPYTLDILYVGHIPYT